MIVGACGVEGPVVVAVLDAGGSWCCRWGPSSRGDAPLGVERQVAMVVPLVEGLPFWGVRCAVRAWWSTLRAWVQALPVLLGPAGGCVGIPVSVSVRSVSWLPWGVSLVVEVVSVWGRRVLCCLWGRGVLRVRCALGVGCWTCGCGVWCRCGRGVLCVRF